MDKKIQLFLLPFAGGNSLSFMKLIRTLDSSIDAVTVEYPGRLSRHNEPFIETYDAFLDDVVKYIQENKRKDIPFAILGYSLGTTLAFDICSKELLGEKPAYAFFCAEGSLLAQNLARKYGKLSDEEFKDKMLMLGGFDQRIFGNEKEKAKYLNLIKKDFNILEQFVYTDGKVPCDASVIYSMDDTTCIQMEDWSELIDGKVDYYRIGGGHFFVKKHYRETAEIINKHLYKWQNRKKKMHDQLLY